MYDKIPIYQTNIVAIILMIITIFNMKKNISLKVLSDKLFFVLILAVCILSFFEVTGFVFDQRSFPGAQTLNLVFNVILFSLTPIPAYIWVLYVHNKVFNDKEKLLKTAKILTIPILIEIILSFANLFAPIFFTITENNEYKRAPFFFIATILSFFYILYSAVIVLHQKKNIHASVLSSVLYFLFFPVVGIVLQLLFFGQSLMWICTSIAIIIIYNNVQNNYSNIDWLTRTYNRKHYDNYLKSQCKQKRVKKLVGFMMDLNDFKFINDNYGHLEGDAALQNTALLLTDVLGYERYVARYAGDEFVALFEIDKEEDIQVMLQEINRRIEVYNLSSDKEYTLGVSIGYAIYDGFQSPKEFLKLMDINMYKEKERIKNLGH